MPSSPSLFRTGQLAEGAEFLKRDGTVQWTGNGLAGGNKLLNLGAATTSGGAARLNDLFFAMSQGLLSSMHEDCVTVTTSNLTGFTGTGSSLGGATVSANDRVLVAGQTTTGQNGIYVYTAAAGGTLTRAADADGSGELAVGGFVRVSGGTNANTVWYISAAGASPILPGMTTHTWTQFLLSSIAAATFTQEVPSGSVNSSNTAFTLAHTPLAGSVHVYLNGQLQWLDAMGDATLSGTTITFGTAPTTGDRLLAIYAY